MAYIRHIFTEKSQDMGNVYIDSMGAVYSADKKVFRRIPIKSCNGVYRVLDGVEEISISMTFGSNEIDTFILPDSVIKLSRRSFGNFSNLRKINIPNSVDTIESGVLSGCQKLKEIVVGSPHFVLEDGILYNKDKTDIIATFPALIKANVVLPLSVKAISWYAFRAHSKLKSITIPNPDATIEPGALCGCSNLTEIDIANPSYTIEKGMLYYNTPEERILLVAFNKLIEEHITVDESVSQIACGAFDGCESLRSVNVMGMTTRGSMISLDNGGKKSNCEAIYIPNSREYQDTYYDWDDDMPYRPKTNILYIHGLKRGDSSKESRTATILREALDSKRYCVYAPTFPTNATEALKLAQKIIVEYHIDIVIGSSLGGFTALALREILEYYPQWTEEEPSIRNITRIVINPCIRPDLELPKRGNSAIADSYSELVDSLWDNITPEEQEQTVGIFSDNDELFSYRKEFLEHYSTVVDIKDGHRISEYNIRKVVVQLVKKH